MGFAYLSAALLVFTWLIFIVVVLLVVLVVVLEVLQHGVRKFVCLLVCASHIVVVCSGLDLLIVCGALYRFVQSSSLQR